MRLSELRSQQGSSHRSTEAKQAEPGFGVIRNSAVYPRPIDARYEGQPVTLLATGDISGMSPAVQIVDEHGRIDWVSSNEVTVTQREYLPQSDSTHNRLRQQNQSSSAFSQT